MRNSIESFEKELNLSQSSINSYTNSNFNFPNSFINKNNKNDNSYIKQKGSKDQNQIIKINLLNNKFTFKVDNENSKSTILSSKKKLSFKSKLNQSELKTYNEKNTDKQIKVIKDEKNSNNSNNDSNISNDSYKYNDEKTKEIIKDYNDLKILTLKDVNHKFSEKIKKKIKKRKVIEKLKEFLKLSWLKINKNLLDLYINHNSINKSNENEELNNLSNSISSLNNKILSKIFETSNNEDINLFITKNKNLYINHTFKKITIESFEIKSSYKNLNALTNGKIIKNKKYKCFIENLITKNINKNSLTTDKKEKGKNKEDGELYSESKISKMKLKKFISDEFKNISKKFYYQNTEQNTENICNSFEDKKVEQKIMISSRFFDKNLENKNTIKKMDLFAQQNEDVKNIDNNSIQSNNIIYNNIEGKQIYISKKSNNSNQNKNNSNIFKNLFENKNNSKSENILLFQNNNNNSFTKMIKINNNEIEKSKICDIFWFILLILFLFNLLKIMT